MKFQHLLHTDGSGLWSSQATCVKTTNIELVWVDDDNSFGELRVYFDTADWDCSTQGLIYTDHLFLSELQTTLEVSGMSAAAIDYSEQGMQDYDYVSLDVGADFIKITNE